MHGFWQARLSCCQHGKARNKCSTRQNQVRTRRLPDTVRFSLDDGHSQVVQESAVPSSSHSAQHRNAGSPIHPDIVSCYQIIEEAELKQQFATIILHTTRALRIHWNDGARCLSLYNKSIQLTHARLVCVFPVAVFRTLHQHNSIMFNAFGIGMNFNRL